jgi:hypothetical protein
MLSNIDVGKRSESTNPADKDQILDVVKKTVGMQTISIFVASRIRDLSWSRALTKTCCQNGPNDSQIGFGRCATCLRRVA